jgi:hypothetical protein
MVDELCLDSCLDGIASWASWACMTFDFFCGMDGWVDAFFIRSVMDLGHGPGERSC